MGLLAKEYLRQTIYANNRTIKKNITFLYYELSLGITVPDITFRAQDLQQCPNIIAQLVGSTGRWETGKAPDKYITGELTNEITGTFQAMGGTGSVGYTLYVEDEDPEYQYINMLYDTYYPVIFRYETEHEGHIIHTYEAFLLKGPSDTPITAGTTLRYRSGGVYQEDGTYSMQGLGYAGSVIKWFFGLDPDHPLPVEPEKEDPEQSQDIYQSEAGAPINGTHDWTSDRLDPVHVPTVGGLTSSMIKAYVIDDGIMNNLHWFFWNDENFLRRITESNMKALDSIISVHVLPFAPITDGEEQITLGTVPAVSQGGIYIMANTIYRRFQAFDCGTITVDNMYGNYLDYAPNTDIAITLPFIGERSLDVNIVMGQSLNVVYYFDVLTGACTAIINVNDDPLYSFSGMCPSQIPLTGQDGKNIYQGFMSAISGAVNTGVGVLKGMLGAQVAGSGGGVQSGDLAAISYGGGEVAGGLNEYTAGLIQMMTPDSVHRNGALSNAISMVGERKPFITIISPKQNEAWRQSENKGGRLRRGGLVGDFYGYSEFDVVHLDGIPATSEELKRIENKLKTGVIV